MVWTTIAAMRNGEGPLFFSYRLGPQTVTTTLGTKPARISHVPQGSQHRPTVRLASADYQLVRAAHHQLASTVHTINNELVRLVRDGNNAPALHTITVNDGGIDISIDDSQPVARVALNLNTGRLEVSQGPSTTPVPSLVAALQHIAGLSGGACPPVTVRFEGQRMTHADALQRPGEPAEVFFLRVAQPEHIEEGLLRLASVDRAGLPALLKHGAMSVLVATSVRAPALEATLLDTARVLLASRDAQALPSLVQALCERLSRVETHPPALYALVHLAAGVQHAPEEVAMVCDHECMQDPVENRLASSWQPRSHGITGGCMSVLQPRTRCVRPSLPPGALPPPPPVLRAGPPRARRPSACRSPSTGPPCVRIQWAVGCFTSAFDAILMLPWCFLSQCMHSNARGSAC